MSFLFALLLIGLPLAIVIADLRYPNWVETLLSRQAGMRPPATGNET